MITYVYVCLVCTYVCVYWQVGGRRAVGKAGRPLATRDSRVALSGFFR